MGDEFTISVKQPGCVAFIIAAGDVCVGDYPLREMAEGNVNITIDPQEAEELFAFLRRELGR
jgi:hypothetical protein